MRSTAPCDFVWSGASWKQEKGVFRSRLTFDDLRPGFAQRQASIDEEHLRGSLLGFNYYANYDSAIFAFFPSRNAGTCSKLISSSLKGIGRFIDILLHVRSRCQRFRQRRTFPIRLFRSPNIELKFSSNLRPEHVKPFVGVFVLFFFFYHPKSAIRSSFSEIN